MASQVKKHTGRPMEGNEERAAAEAAVCDFLDGAGVANTTQCHPCVNTASVALSLRDLLEKVVPATGHTFTWVNLPTRRSRYDVKI